MIWDRKPIRKDIVAGFYRTPKTFLNYMAMYGAAPLVNRTIGEQAMMEASAEEVDERSHLNLPPRIHRVLRFMPIKPATPAEIIEWYKLTGILMERDKK